MNIRILTVSRRQPAWINSGYEEYARRFSGAFRMELVEVDPADRRGGESARQIDTYRQLEARRLQTQVRSGEWVVALDEAGSTFSTQELAQFVGRLRDEARSPVFIIGGADGLDPALLQSADSRISLSALTLPHGLVRVILAEALYRAVSLLNNHPYHRA